MLPASNVAFASINVVPHAAWSSRIAQSSAAGPRSPTGPGWTIRHRTVRQTASGMARRKNGATTRSGRNKRTASVTLSSFTSSSTESSWPRSASSTWMRWVSALKLVASNRMRIVPSADARQLLAGEPVDHALAADARRHAHETRRVGDHFADHHGVAAEWMAAKDAEQTRGVFCRHDCDKLALVGDVQGIETEQFTGPENFRQDRYGGFVEPHPHGGLVADLVERRRQTAAGRIAQYADGRHGGHHVGDQAVERRGIRHDGGFEFEAGPVRHDGDAVIAHAAGDQDCIAGARALARNFNAGRHHADAGGVDEEAVGLAALDHLGVAGDDRDAGGARGCAHRTGDALEIGERKALFDDEPG